MLCTTTLPFSAVKDVAPSLGESTVVAGAQTVGATINAIGNALTPSRVTLSEEDKRFFKLVDALPPVPNDSTPELKTIVELNAKRKIMEAGLTTSEGNNPASRKELESVEAALSKQINKLAPTATDQERLIAQLAAQNAVAGLADKKPVATQASDRPHLRFFNFDQVRQNNPPGRQS